MLSFVAQKIAKDNVDDSNDTNNSANFSTQTTNVNDKEIVINLQELNAFFNKAFNKEPEFFVRVPGRVNIIGEHIDYNLLSVLPMAIDSCILLAVAATPDKSILELKNLEHNKYADFKCNVNDITINVPEEGKMASHGWYNYFLCGLKGICDVLISRNSDHQPPLLHGMQVAVYGTIPPASGLSSSSALVCSAIIATAYVHKMDWMDAKQLAELAARSERFIGTEGGGMDQAIAFLAKDGYAQKIAFHPRLQTTLIPLPRGLCFVVANSMISKNKAATSDFNERVIECRLACRLIAHYINIPQWTSILTFKELMDKMDNKTYEQKIEIIKKYIDKDLYTRQELCDILKLNDYEFSKQFLTANTKHMQHFKIKQRALHVVQEFQRVEKFCELCKNASLTTNPMECFNKLKELISESHKSLRLLYECSHPELDKLVDLAENLNIGARLMGAGWGGCILALCSSIEQCQQLINLLKETFYKNLPNDIIERNLFIATPKDGAEIIFKKVANTSIN